MSDRTMRVLTMVFLLGGGSLIAGATPAFACHEATGWCCTADREFCCYFEKDDLKEETCFFTDS